MLNSKPGRTAMAAGTLMCKLDGGMRLWSDSLTNLTINDFALAGYAPGL